MAKIVYNESDSILIRSVLKIGLKSLKKKNALNSFEDLQRISSIIKDMEAVEHPKSESGSTTAIADCRECE
jgi:hypothetical protein|tara:strand:+ start:2410 stop:2622 length:213 start_codon:yes stop_codon:yes gene_type:complete